MARSGLFVFFLLCSSLILSHGLVHGKPTDHTERNPEDADEDGQLLSEHPQEEQHGPTNHQEDETQPSFPKANKENVDYFFPDINQDLTGNDENEDMFMMADEQGKVSEHTSEDETKAVTEPEGVETAPKTTEDLVSSTTWGSVDSTTAVTEVEDARTVATLESIEQTTNEGFVSTTEVGSTDVARLSSTENTQTETSENASEVYETTVETLLESTTTTLEPTTPEDSENAVEDDVTSTTVVVDPESSSTTSPEVEANKELALRKVNRLSDQIRLVLQQYKTSGSITIPDVPIPDPMAIPDMDQRISMGSMNFRNMQVYGLKNFTVQHINTDLEKMQVYMMLKMERLIIIGNYTLRSFLTRASGPFTVILYNVTTEGAAELRRDEGGQLEASETEMDMSFNDIKLDFKNLGFLGSFFQGVMGAVGSFLFDGIKPYILAEVNTNMRAQVNAKIKTMTDNFKMSEINPIDQAVIEGRRYVRDQGYDPYLLQNYTKSLGLFTVNITEFRLNGLSRFYRVGEVALSMDSGVVEAGVHLGTDRLSGSCSWSFGIGNASLRKGRSNFTVAHLQVRGIVQQSLNLTDHPKLDDLDFLLGRIDLKTNRQDTIDYMLETVVNGLPSLLRHIIVDGLEDPIRVRFQEILDEVDVQALVDEKLPVLDNFGV